MSQSVPYLDSVSFAEALASSEQPLLVDFTASWCPPCKMMAPVLDELADDLAGSLRIAKVDVDAQVDIASRYGVQSMPTFLVFRDGQPVARFVGARSKRQFATELDQVLNSAPARG